MRRLVFVYYLPLDASLERLYAVDHLAAAGIPVEWWDLSAAYGMGSAVRAPLARAFVRRVDSLAAFRGEAAAAARDGAAFVAVFPYEPRTIGAYRTLTATGAPLYYYAVGMQPTPEGSLARRAGGQLDYLFRPKKLLNFLGRRAGAMLRRAGFVKPYDAVFAAGEAAAGAYPARRVVAVNHPDYDERLASGPRPSPVAGRYAVFLDENMAGHPDLAVLGVAPIDAGRYHAALDAFFTALERRHGLRVVVAAHPKSEYRGDPFRGRVVLKGATRALVDGCEFAVTTFSSSLGYAVLARKPLVFFTTDEIATRYATIQLDVFPPLFARTLGRECLNLDRPEQSSRVEVPPVDEALYDAYKYRYLVSRASEGRASREVCAEFYKDALGAPAEVA